MIAVKNKINTRLSVSYTHLLGDELLAHIDPFAMDFVCCSRYGFIRADPVDTFHENVPEYRGI